MFSRVLTLFGLSARTPDEAVEVADKAERTIEDRLEAIKAKLAAGGYARLSPGEMESFVDDLQKVLAFIESALNVIGNAKPDAVVGESLRRLRYVKTRVTKLKEEQQRLRAEGSATG